MTRDPVVYQVDPLQDPRWYRLLLKHPAATIFHMPEWLEALQRTYHYEPIVFTTSPPDRELSEGVVMCRVNSWLTGQRLVSLPFSDHCEPLVNSVEAFQHLLASIKLEAARKKYKYIEFRPFSLLAGNEFGLKSTEKFHLHRIDLDRPVDELFRRFHKSNVQKKIQRAEREALVYEDGRSDGLVRKFYDLQVITRRRQQLAPQPFAWFRNLVACMGDRLKIRIVSKNGTVVASILTIQFRRTLVYKYGSSDKIFSNLGGTQLLMWRALQEAKSDGLSEFDLGRSDWENEGLVLFKDRLGATKTTMTYWRYPAGSVAFGRKTWTVGAAKRVFACLPRAWLATTGSLLYRHIG